MVKLKLKGDIFKSSNRLHFFDIYLNLSKNVLAKYYQENKKILQKKLLSNKIKKSF